MILALPTAALVLLATHGWRDTDVVVFRHHPGLYTATRVQEAARWRDEVAILDSVKNAGIGYRYAGGLGSGYELSIRIQDHARWLAISNRLHKHRSLAYYSEWQTNLKGYGLLEYR